MPFQQTASIPLRAQLERDRLEQRARRVENVLLALHGRARQYDPERGVPRGLARAIEEFTAERDAVRRTLSGLPSGGPRA